MTITHQIETITPEIASRYLDTNIANFRRINNGRVAKMVHDMATGEWTFTGAPISFTIDQNGNEVLADGQHRLTAIVLSGVTIPMLVIRNIDRSAVRDIDTGRIRLTADYQRFLGRSNVNVMSAGARLVLLYRARAFDKGGGYSNAANVAMMANRTAVANEIDANASLYDEAATTACSMKTKTRLIGSSLTAFYVIAHQEPTSPFFDMAAAVQEFLGEVASGANLPAGNPALALRNWAAINGTKVKSRPNAVHLSALIRAFNASITGGSMMIVKPWQVGNTIGFPSLVKLTTPTRLTAS